MKKLITLSFIVIYIFSYTANAKQVNKETAERVALEFIKQQKRESSKNSLSIKRVSVTNANIPSLRAIDEETPYYYIYNIGENDGFVIVSGDDRISPILGYSTSGQFDFSHLPPATDKLLCYYQDLIKNAIDSNLTPSDIVKQNWVKTETGNIETKNLQTALWDQGSPYNDKCPVYQNNDRSMTGCGATALSIIMKHHRWPATGKGGNSYESESLNGNIPISESFEGTPYRWDLMPDKYIDENYTPIYTPEEADAVSTIMYHAGVASSMNYGIDSYGSSGAYFSNMATALTDNFGYTCKFVYKKYYSSSEWNRLIYDNINKNEPLIYRGADEFETNGGHFFIIDGYQYIYTAENVLNEQFYHINWGWGGYLNGFFRLDNLYPQTGLDFSFGNSAIINIQKITEGGINESDLAWYEDDGTYTADKFLKKSTEIIQPNTRFEITIDTIFNSGAVPIDGKLGLLLINENGAIINIISNNFNLNPSYYQYGMRITGSFPSVSATDRIKLAYTDGPNGEWKDIRGYNGAIYSIPASGIDAANSKIEKDPTNIIFSQNRLKADTHNENNIIRQIYLFDIDGRKLIDICPNSSSVSIPTGNIPIGAYIVKVQTSRESITQRIIKY